MFQVFSSLKSYDLFVHQNQNSIHQEVLVQSTFASAMNNYGDVDGNGDGDGISVLHLLNANPNLWLFLNDLCCVRNRVFFYAICAYNPMRSNCVYLLNNAWVIDERNRPLLNAKYYNPCNNAMVIAANKNASFVLNRRWFDVRLRQRVAVFVKDYVCYRVLVM